ncbi:DUF3152 domain-containing protein [Antrihabitans sp. YC3-6]|uniref:DUF3152 domain-containing protein n=1 Tax=Antrihabitans stalagmiti TaxID=2799499 RepID=A0A934U1J4_9NOCA|nr:DUF3152 domain-containing protein [Antrihabitans stalagmiti]MBJ8338355.1 DUF3152 domain-containing protein [Antrihabitans stalagmiti]
MPSGARSPSPFEAKGGGYGPARSHQPLRAQWDPTTRDEGRARQPRPERRTKRQSRIGRFAANYGWRAYAIPILLAVTAFVVVDAVRSVDTAVAADPDRNPGFGELSHDSDGTGVVGVPPRGDGSFDQNVPTGVLPPGGNFSPQGAGEWHVVAGTTPQIGAGTERVFTYTVEVENGVDTASYGGDQSFAVMVDQTLANPKSWTQDPRFGFRRIDQGEPDFRVSLTSTMTTRDVCGYDIPLDTSCNNLNTDRVVLNEARWVRGAVSYQGDVGSYRQYLINHEVGHAIGYEQHQPCETDGGLAPVMMQQSFGTANNDIATLDPEGVVPMDGKVCRFNPWPYPRG